MRDVLVRAWTELSRVTPLVYDCGALCGAACCAPDEDGQGAVHLFPGEREMIGRAPWARFERSGELGGCDVLVCDGTCERAKRPLGCRIFPLTPVRARDGWTVKLDRRAWAMCPLARSGVRGLGVAFVDAARAAVRTLGEDGEMAAFMRAWARCERAYRQAL